MSYGFIIDNRRCIGCHACSVACKAEHKVPLGGFRTWVKSVEKGSFPDVRRHFTVLRCNHCEDAPCVNICPTASLYRRPDGIVDFESSHCIGCRACMAACPYDAIYIDANTGTISKVLGDGSGSRISDVVAREVERGEAGQVLGDSTRSRIPASRWSKSRATARGRRR